MDLNGKLLVTVIVGQECQLRASFPRRNPRQAALHKYRNTPPFCSLGLSLALVPPHLSLIRQTVSR